MNKQSSRVYLGKNYTNLPPIDLTAVQSDSWQWFLSEGISQGLAEVSPIEDFTGKNWTLSFGEHSFGKPSRVPSLARAKGLSFDAPLKVKATLTNKQTGKIVEQEVFLGDIPQMTNEGTFIVNGIERAVVNQIVRAPGVFFTGKIDPVTGRMLYTAEIRPTRGAWLEFFVNRNDVISVRIDRRRKYPVTNLTQIVTSGIEEKICQGFLSIF